APRLARLEPDLGETLQLLFGSWGGRLLAVHINLCDFSAGAFACVLHVKRKFVARAGRGGVSYRVYREIAVSEVCIGKTIAKREERHCLAAFMTAITDQDSLFAHDSLPSGSGATA